MTIEREAAYVGRENRIRRTLRINGAELTQDQRDAVTRVVATWGSIALDTDVQSDPISYIDGVVELQPGLATGIAEGEFDVKLTVFDAVSVQGRAWGHFVMDVWPWAAGE